MKGGGGGVSELESRSDNFKTIAKHKSVDTNLSPTKQVYRGVTKILCLVRARAFCYQHPNPNKPEEINKFKCKAFDSLINFHKNNYFDKMF